MSKPKIYRVLSDVAFYDYNGDTHYYIEFIIYSSAGLASYNDTTQALMDFIDCICNKYGLTYDEVREQSINSVIMWFEEEEDGTRNALMFEYYIKRHVWLYKMGLYETHDILS